MIDTEKFYELTSNVGDMALKRRIKTIIEYLDMKPKDRILDCGCGNGFHLMIIHNLGESKLYGFDLDKKLLIKAKKKIGNPSVKLTYGEIYQIPYQDASFDKIVLSEVLEHIPDDLMALREVSRVLKKKGLLIITVPNHNYPFLWDPVNKLLEFFTSKHISHGFWAGIWNMHLRLYKRNEIIELVRKANFEIEEIENLTHYCFPFNHVILYGLKRMLDKDILPKRISHTADKFAWNKSEQSRLVKIGYSLLNKFDGLNENIPIYKSSAGIVLKAIKI